MKIDCIYWEAVEDRRDVGGCKPKVHGAYLVTKSRCETCTVRTTEAGRVRRTLRLPLASEVFERAAYVKPICSSCPDLICFTEPPGGVFQGIIKCRSCPCAMKMMSIFQPCPLKKFP